MCRLLKCFNGPSLCIYNICKPQKLLDNPSLQHTATELPRRQFLIFLFNLFRAAQRLANNNAAPKARVPDMPTTARGGYCGALQRAPPAMPAGLARRLANKDNFGMGKVIIIVNDLANKFLQ